MISAPVSSFVNQFTGGDGTFNGALDEIVIVVAGVQGAVGSTVEVDFDQISFTGGSQPPSQIIDDFENGLPAGVDGDGVSVGFITFSDGSPISIAITDAPPAPVPGAAAGNNVLAMTGDVLSFAGFVHAFENAAADAWVPQDWSSYEGFSFWLYGQNSGTTLFVDLIDNRNPGSTRDDAERFSVSFVDDFSGWKQFEFPFASFVRKDIGNGAPNDGLTLTQMHGWAFGALNTGGERTYYVDDTAVYGIAEIPDLAVTFASANYNVAEGTTGNIVVKLNRPMNSDDPAQVSVDYTSEPGTATVAQDYLPTSGTLTFVNGGPSELSFPLETLEDSKFEGGESVILRLSNPVDVAQGFSFQAGASIQDNDAYDANLLDDFEKGAYLWDANDLAGLETQLVTATDPLAIPGQDAFETILQVSSSATAVQPLIEAVNDELDDLYPTGDFRVDLWLFLAGQQLDRSLRSAYWENDAYLDARRGSIVFSYLNVAITDLRLAGLPRNAPTAELDQLIEELMDSVAALAQNQLDLAVASGGNGRLINQAQSQIDKAERDADRGRLVTAVAYYRNAWVKAVAAMRHVEPATASFVRDFALGQDWSHGEALTFWYYGSNSGDEITVNLKENRAPDPGPSGWNMVWSEEFNDPAGTPPNPEYWSYEIGDGTVNGIPGWGNDEFQYYTDDPANAATDGNGNMVLTVREADGSLQCYYGPCEYTSARLISWRKAEFAYGRIESRILVPDGEAGLWPAFWSLGTDIDVVNWPQTGEIDFMEYVSRLPNEVFGTVHGPGYSGGQSFGNVYDFGGPMSAEYHTITIEWQPDLIEWYVDGILYHTATPADVSGEWVFNDPVFLLLNVAIGGNFGGTIDPNLQLPQSMAVDYIRVYQGPDTAERFETTFVDNFTGWQQVEIPFTSFVRSAEQPAGAPNDGLSFEEVWGYGFSLPAGSSAALDQVRVKPVPPPTALTVTTLADSGDGSLRDAIERLAPDGTITFDPALAGGTIALTSGQLNVARSMTIDGSGAPGLTVSGSNASRVFQMAAGAVVNLNNLTVADGVGALQGGGILNYGVLNLESVVVMNNTESSTGAADFQLGGGGIYNGDGATLNMNNSAVMNNRTLGQPGGGIYGFFNSSINITNSTVSGNVAGDVAGGLRTLGNVTVINSTLSGNVSTAWHGGAMFSTDGTVTILNSTIVGNTAPGGTAGGLMIATFGAPVAATIQNSLIADNGTYNCQLEGNPALASLTSLGNNVVTDGSCQPVGSDIVVAPGGAGVDVLADNGGPTLTHALLAGSVAIDAANTAVCPTTDQRGITRDAACDVGAFEYIP
ncbi:MAG: carbohydrate binding domain-containing protein [Chloroflexota bacterium]